MTKVLSLIFVFLAYFSLSASVFSQENMIEQNQFITIVNPVRISTYNKDPQKSLAAQYEETQKRNLPATWLLTYDALNNTELTKITNDMDAQEFGILLEVSAPYAQAAGVTYTQTDSWHRSNSLFLIGYSQEDRQKLIDTVFEKFKSTYGYYPKSVGAWWVDSYSLEYMQQKYGIIANLTCADQFFTDGYSLWGQYWSTPFYPSKNHAGQPARTLDTKLNIVTLQWAARDPFNGYLNKKASLYSSQDYHTVGLREDYFENLIKLYALKNKNQFGQITIGLEADLSEETYRNIYAKNLDVAKNLSEKFQIKITTMSEFSNQYRQIFPTLSPVQMIESNDLLDKQAKIIWYQSPAYRLGLTYDYTNHETKVIDFRIYTDNFQEPFYQSPLGQWDLYINIPSLLDQASNPNSHWIIQAGEIVSVNNNGDELIINYSDNKIINLSPNKLTLNNIATDLPPSIKQSGILNIKNTNNLIELTPQQSWPLDFDGLVFRNLPPHVLYFANLYNLTKPSNSKRIAVIGFFLMALILIIYKFSLYRKKHFKIITGLFFIIIVIVLIHQSKLYFVSQSEIDALLHLKSLPDGKVVVYGGDCLKCRFHSTLIPAASVNLKNYIHKISGKKVVHNTSIFTAINKDQGKKELDNLKANYIYLIKFEYYIEQLPFNSQDYNLEKIYENANAQIWKVKNN